MTEIQNPKQKNNRFEPVWSWRFICNLVLEIWNFIHKTPRQSHLSLTWPKGPSFSGQNKIILLADGSKAQNLLSKYLPFIANIHMLDGKATAYVCEDYACKLPTTDVTLIVGLLEGLSPKPHNQ